MTKQEENVSEDLVVDPTEEQPITGPTKPPTGQASNVLRTGPTEPPSDGFAFGLFPDTRPELNALATDEDQETPDIEEGKWGAVKLSAEHEGARRARLAVSPEARATEIALKPPREAAARGLSLPLGERVSDPEILHEPEIRNPPVDLREDSTTHRDPGVRNQNVFNPFKNEPRMQHLKFIRGIGEGAFGDVFLAHNLALSDEASPMEVAVKVCPGRGKKIVPEMKIMERLKREVRAAMRVASRNTCKVWDFIKLDDGRSAIVMEYVDGKSLKATYKAQAARSYTTYMEWSRGLAQALTDMHDAGVVHRDRVMTESCVLG